MKTPPRLFRTILFVSAATVWSVGCETSVSQEERKALVTAYAESLIARQLFPGDSLATLRAVDSTLQLHGFESIAAFESEIDRLSLQSEVFRQMLDSTHSYLERAQSTRTPPVDSLNR